MTLRQKQLLGVLVAHVLALILWVVAVTFGVAVAVLALAWAGLLIYLPWKLVEEMSG